MLGRFAQPFLAKRHRTHFSGKAQFPEGNQILREQPVVEAGHGRQHCREIRGGLAECLGLPQAVVRIIAVGLRCSS